MRHDGVETVVVLGPVVEDRPAVEPDHVGHVCRREFRLEGQAEPLEQAQQVEFALQMHRLHDLVGGEILDPNDEVQAHGAELFRQPGVGMAPQRLDVREARRDCGTPAVGKGAHADLVGSSAEGTKRLTGNLK